MRKSTFQQIRLNSAQHVWISIKEEWADTFDPIIGHLRVGYPKIRSCIHNLFKLLTNLVEFYPAIQKETAKPKNAHSLGPMQGGTKKQKTVMLLLTHLCVSKSPNKFGWIQFDRLRSQ